MTYGEKALTLKHETGCNCAQAVLGCCCEELGMDWDTAYHVSAFFGGGMRVGETCGAVTGALMAIGLKYGDENNRQCEVSKSFLEAFQKEFESLKCDVLLKGDDANKKILCPGYIRFAADYLEKEL